MNGHDRNAAYTLQVVAYMNRLTRRVKSWERNQRPLRLVERAIPPLATSLHRLHCGYSVA
jgi:hypothetical protein